jgi:nicotinamide-nucleotide amidase
MSAGVDGAVVRRAHEVMRLLAQREHSVVTAESCTAGLLATVLSQADGASTCLHGGFITYTKAQKTVALGVPADLLESMGSVNADVAKAMAEGALRCSRASIAIALTGVLGPDEDEDGNPVGLVVFACAKRGQGTEIVEKLFPQAEPDRLRNTVIGAALDLVEAAITESAIP